MCRDDLPAAIFLDAYGTLLELDRPVERLHEALTARGSQVTVSDVATAFRAEVAFYRQHQDGGGDPAGLTALRHECARVFGATLSGAPLPVGVVQEALLEGLRYRLFDDVVPALDALRGSGRSLAVVSNWDMSLEGVLAELGIRAQFDTVVASAVLGVRKPDPRIFLETCRRVGVEPSRALHVGDEPEIDGHGASRAGLAFRRIDRSGGGDDPNAIRSLSELVALSTDS